MSILGDMSYRILALSTEIALYLFGFSEVEIGLCYDGGKINEFRVYVYPKNALGFTLRGYITLDSIFFTHYRIYSNFWRVFYANV